MSINKKRLLKRTTTSLAISGALLGSGIVSGVFNETKVVASTNVNSLGHVKPVLTSGNLRTGVQTLSGTAAPGSVIAIHSLNSSGGNRKWIAGVMTDNNGNWTIKSVNLLGDHIQVISTFQGVEQPYGDILPVVSSKPVLTSGTPIGGVQTLSGTAAPGSVIAIHSLNSSGGNRKWIAGVMTDNNGNWTIKSVNLPDDGGSIQVISTFQGVEQPYGDILLVNTKPVITGTIPGVIGTGSTTISGTAAPGATVDTYSSNGKTSTVAGNDGKWTINFARPLESGTIYAWSKGATTSTWVKSDNLVVRQLAASEVLKLSHSPYLSRGYANDSLATGTAPPGATVEVWEDSCGKYDLGKKGVFQIGSVTGISRQWIYKGNESFPFSSGYKYAFRVNLQGVVYTTPFMDAVARPTNNNNNSSGISFDFSWGDFPHVTLFP